MATSYGYDRQRPRTNVSLNAGSLGAANVASEKPLVLIGSATGGEPHVPYELNNYSQAREIFRSGELLDAIEMAWNPSPSLQGAGKIIAIRTDEATQATYEDAGLKFTSKLYGVDANDIQVEYTTNSLTGAKRVGVYFTKERYERTYDNVGNIFTVKYTGEEAAATAEVVVDAETGVAKRLVLSAGADAGALTAVRTYTLGQGVYQDAHVLVNDINNLPDFEAQMNTLGGNKNVDTDALDVLEATDIKNTSATVTAVAADLKNQLANDKYIAVSTDPKQALPDAMELANLTGAETNPSPASWAGMFDTLIDLDVYYIVPLTANEAIHGELAQFLTDESKAGHHLRGIVGGELDETMEDIRARQMNLRKARIGLVGDSTVRRMPDGRVLDVPAYLYAALVAGIASGLAIGEPLTYKSVNIEGLKRRFTGDQLDQLHNSGVIMTEYARGRGTSHFRLVSDPTTYNVATEPVMNRVSLGEVSDFLTTELREVLDSEFIGTRVRNTSASIIKNRVESFLDQQKKVGGLIVDYNPDDVQVIISGNTATINITVQPSQGLDYINVNLTYEDNELVA
jgi:hypothetical protein